MHCIKYPIEIRLNRNKMGFRKRRACEAQVSSLQIHGPSLNNKRTKAGDTSWNVVYAGGDIAEDLCAENVLSVTSMWLKRDSNSETKHKLFSLATEQSCMANRIAFQPGFADRRYARRRSRKRRELNTTTGAQEDAVCCSQKQERFDQTNLDAHKYSLPGQTFKDSGSCSHGSVLTNTMSFANPSKHQISPGERISQSEKANKSAIYDIYDSYTTACTDNTISVSASTDTLCSYNKSVDIYESYETYPESSSSDITKSTAPDGNKYYQRERRFPLAEGLHKKIIKKKLRNIGVEAWWPKPIHIAWLVGGGYITEDDDYSDLSLDDGWNDAEDGDGITEEIPITSTDHYSEKQNSVDIGMQCEQTSNNHSKLSSNRNKYSVSLNHDDSGYTSGDNDAIYLTWQNSWEKLFDICLDMLSKLRL